MNWAMAQQKDYLETIIKMLQDNAAQDRTDIRRLERKIEENTRITNEVHEQAKLTNGRVNNHDSQLKAIWKKLDNFTSSVSSSSILSKIDSKVWFIVALTVLLLVAAGVGPETVKQIKELL